MKSHLVISTAQQAEAGDRVSEQPDLGNTAKAPITEERKDVEKAEKTEKVI